MCFSDLKNIIDALLDAKLISSFDDIFTLKKGDILNLPRFAEKSADNLIQAIEKARTVSLPRLLTGLSIPHVGEETAEDIAEHFGTIGRVRVASFEELEGIEGVGPIVGRSIVEWFSNKENARMLDHLLAQVTLKRMEKKEKKGVLLGKTFVLTGTLLSLPREDAKKKIKNAGGSVSSAVSAKTDYVLAGENPGSKLDKANELRVKIISEAEFLKMFG